MMYNILKTIKKVKVRKSRIKLALLFIEELGGTMTHLHNIGMIWGAGGEAVGANLESIKCRKIINGLKEYVMELLI